MKSLTVLLAGFLVGAATVVGVARSEKDDSAMLAAYTPSRLEWTALELESYYRSEFSDNFYSLDFVATPPNTIKIVIQYTDQASAGVVDKAIDTAKDLVSKEARSNGWSKLIRVEVERSRLSSTNK
jgi:hypothetical protein